MLPQPVAPVRAAEFAPKTIASNLIILKKKRTLTHLAISAPIFHAIKESRSMPTFPENVLDLLNANMGGFNEAVGLRFIKAEPDEYVAEISITDRHLQPYGLVHGGVYAGMIETLCSTGAALTVWEENKSTVGLENNTSFLKAVRGGRLRCTARPLVLGKRSHVWEASIHDDADRLVAAGRVRLLVLEPGAQAAGAKVEMQTDATWSNPQ